jgi:hypothetical protein
MFKKTVLVAIPIGCYFAYRKLTEFETNVIIISKNYNEYAIKTNKGQFICNMKVISELETGENYHIKAYGIDYPNLHLHKKLIWQNGTPCDLLHCNEKKSILDSFI